MINETKENDKILTQFIQTNVNKAMREKYPTVNDILEDLAK